MQTELLRYLFLHCCCFVSCFECNWLQGGDGYPAREFRSQRCFWYCFYHCHVCCVRKFHPLHWHHVIYIVEALCQSLSLSDWTVDMPTKQEKSSLSNVSGIDSSLPCLFVRKFDPLQIRHVVYHVETIFQRSSDSGWTVDMTTELEKSDPDNVSGIILSLPYSFHHIT